MSIEGGGSTEAEDEPNGAGSDAACVICMDRPKNTALVPCGHQLCSVCQPQLQVSGGQQRCHMCQQPVERHVRLY